MSYASADAANARQMYDTLRGAGLRCWMAPDDLPGGVRYPGALTRAVRDARVVAVLVSAQSDGSPHVLSEVREAFDGGCHLLPIDLDGTFTSTLSDDLRYYLRSWQSVDATRGVPGVLPALISTVQRLAVTPPPPRRQANLDHVASLLLDRSRELLAWPRTTARTWMERPEEAQLRARLGAPHGLTVLLGPPGAGKSALLSAVGDALRGEGWALLAIKADELPKSVDSLSALQAWMGLPLTPEQAIRELARERRVALLFDQVDAVCDLVDRDGRRLDAILALLARVHDLENVHVVLSCREFEYQHDLRFRRLQADELTLGLPQWDQVARVLASARIDPRGWPASFREALRTPQHLVVFLRHSADVGEARPYESYQSMLAERWLRHVVRPGFTSVIDRIARDVADEEELWLPLARFDESVTAVDALRAAGILTTTRDGLRVGFSHQSLFEFAFARSFAASEGSVAEHVRARQDGLFVRPVLWRTLTYLRAADPRRYRTELDRLWNDNGLRPHLRALLSEFLGSVPAPDDCEYELAVRTLDDPARRQLFLRAAAASAGWFERLEPHELPRLLATAQAWDAQPILRTALVRNRNRVLELLEPLCVGGPEYQALAFSVLVTLGAWDERALGLAITLMRGGHVPIERLRLVSDDLAASAPGLAARFVREAFSGELDRLRAEAKDPDSAPRAARRFRESDWYQLDAIAAAAPEAFVVEILPLVADAIRATERPRRSIVLGYRDDEVLGVDQIGEDSSRGDLVASLAAALAALGEGNPEAAVATTTKWSSSEALGVHRLLAIALAAAAPSRPNDALAYLLGDSRRLLLGDYNDHQRQSAALVEAVAPALSPADCGALEGAVLSSRSTSRDELRNMARASRISFLKLERGHRMRLLRAIGKERLSARARRVLEEEERALPGYGRPRSPGRAGAVGSRMSSEQMSRASDDALLALFEDLPDDTAWDHPRRMLELVGGSIQASREFGALAKAQPERALALIARFKAGRQERPAGEALRVLAEGGGHDELVLQAIDELAARGFQSEAFRENASMALQRIADRGGLPDRACALLESWLKPTVAPALGGDDEPERTPEPILDDHGRYEVLPGGNQTILDAILPGYVGRTPADVSRAVRVLRDHLPRAEDPRVWRAMLRWCQDLMAYDAPTTAALFADVLDRHPLVLASEAGTVLLVWLQPHVDVERSRNWLAALRSSGWKRAHQAAAEVVTELALRGGVRWAIDEIERVVLAADDLPLPIALGAAFTAARWWAIPTARTTATRILRRVLSGPAEARRFTLRAFAPLDTLPVDDATDELLRALIAERQVIATDPLFLAERLGDLVPRRSHLAADVANAIIDEWERQGRASGLIPAAALVDLALTLHRIEAERARGLALFERLMGLRVDEAEHALFELDGRPSAVPAALRRPRLPRPPRRRPPR